jgi:intron-binding protein aquarius
VLGVGVGGRYLWPHFNAAQSSAQHVLSIVLMVNEKSRQRLPAWEVFRDTPADRFSAFFARVLTEALYVLLR